MVCGKLFWPTHSQQTICSDEYRKLTAEYGKIGSNLNQIVKHLNEFGEPYSGMVQKLKAAPADLSGQKCEFQLKISDENGCVQTYQLKE